MKKEILNQIGVTCNLTLNRTLTEVWTVTNRTLSAPPILEIPGPSLLSQIFPFLYLFLLFIVVLEWIYLLYRLNKRETFKI